MRIIKGTMSFNIGLVGADREEDFCIEVPDDAEPGFIEDILQEWYTDFVWERVDGGWLIKSDELIEE